VSAHEAYADTSSASDSDVANLAAAFEILHTAFLIHDDVIDRDDRRRGGLTISGEFAEKAGALLGDEQGQLWGSAAGILAGDLLLVGAHRLIAGVSAPEPVRIQLHELFDDTVYRTAAGELIDVSLSLGVGGGDLTDPLEMSALKTAVYSFEAPLAAGAILAGANAEDIAVLGEYGRLVGLAFQLRDDLLGVFGSEQATGKSASSDLREGKATPLVMYARETTTWQQVEHLHGRRDLSDVDADILRMTLIDCGARDFIEGVIADSTDQAMRVLDSSQLPAALVQQLTALALRLVGRQR
jgi:geranylgeranyl diphosphate synthase type II